ncbi:putative protein serine/threonine kinase [Heterostelium album PN500]|uniref:non-specific serine/threonine protein kinase n=1 Tax=Heterostelium pallidum (strain ATCC 26659 / Pp 5 / PN500) TaxID=670386 RepID=D3B4Z0_HETP5|nr:putative protein serine/threonine kinase [Heterostelium album PN500]EFA84388.1 putative protein serine/threonine kinase [Heterostelium album PN500]|eukprot:XP_020436502.1 putative protein serine/threonine kinase [Heterostelium album PN500]
MAHNHNRRGGSSNGGSDGISPSKRKETIKIGEYALGDKIGKGAYGQVYKGLHSKTGDFVAIKQIDRIKIDANTLQSVKSEVEILQKLNHNNIVKVLGCVESQSQLNFILEYVENGSLRDVLEKFGPLSEELATLYLYQLLHGLAYLHSNRIIHRDIKCSNVLITKEGIIKLADFGVASQLSDEVQLRYSVVGTPYWMAPEAIQIAGQSSSSDIWSLACTAIELTTGNPPYYNLQPMSAMFKIVQDPHPPYPPGISKELEDFLNVSFEKDPNKRPTATELIKHPIFKKINSQLPTLSELQDTLKTLNGRAGKLRASVVSMDWSSGGSAKSLTESGSSTSSSVSRMDDEIVTKLQSTITQQTATIEKMTEEINTLKKEAQDKPFMEEHQFYREYFMALAISVKVNQCYLGKSYEQVSLQNLYELARAQDIPWYSLMEWIPKQIIMKEEAVAPDTKTSQKGSRLSKKFGLKSPTSFTKSVRSSLATALLVAIMAVVIVSGESNGILDVHEVSAARDLSNDDCSSDRDKVTGLTLEGVPSASGCTPLVNNGNYLLSSTYWGYFTSLTNVTFINADFSNRVPKPLYSLSSLRGFQFYGQKCRSNFNQGGDINDNIDNIYVENAVGNFPTLNNELKNIFIAQATGPSSNLVLSKFGDIFSNNLVNCEIYVNTPIPYTGTFTTSQTLSKAPYLRKFALQAPGLATQFSSFSSLPNQLTYLHLRSLQLNDPGFPSYASMSNGWRNLVTLRLENLTFTGTMDSQFFFLPSLTRFHLTDNPSLNLTIPTTYGDNSKIVYLYLSNTGITGTVPDNILGPDQTLQVFYLTNVQGLVGTKLPELFLCLPPSYLTGNTIPAYVFDNVTFNNYQGPDTARNCDPVISSITNPILSNSTFFTIIGKNFGDRPNIVMTSTAGEYYTVNSNYINSNTMLCNTPVFLQGKGNLQLTSTIGLNSKVVTKDYTFNPPTIVSISSPPTLGGWVTLTGYDLLPFSNVNSRDSNVRIGPTLCQNLTSLTVFTQMSCWMPPSIISNLDVIVNVKGLTNDVTNTPKFFYRSPTVQTSIAVVPNVATNLTITGADFWNELDTITVNIPLPQNNVTCNVTFVNHYILVCSFPATGFAPGTFDLQVTVAGLTSARNNLFAFIDTQICPNSCGGPANGLCNVGLGLCNCVNQIAGPSCAEGTAPTQFQTPGINNTIPRLTLNSPNNDTTLSVYLYSIFENNAETIIPSWVQTYDPHANSFQYAWQSGGRTLTVVIRPNNETTPPDVVGPGATLNVFNNTFTYQVNYQTDNSFGDVQFKLQMDVYPEECTAPAINYAYPTLSTNSSVHWLTITKFKTKWFARFPMVATINGGGGSINTTKGVADGLSNRLIVDVVNNQPISTVNFEFDFSSLATTESRTPVTENCNPENNGNNNNGGDSSSNKWKIVVGVVVGVVGAAIILLGGAYIYKQQMKLNETKSLLDKKLRSLNNDL